MDIAHFLIVEGKVKGVLNYVPPEELLLAAFRGGATPEMIGSIHDLHMSELLKDWQQNSTA